MISAILLFILGLILLIKGGDWFVDGSTAVAEKFHVPEILIGATVVSIGTTLPEVMVSATSAAEGIGAMAYGNALGSVICNAALISAITIAVKPAVVDKKPLKLPVIFFFIAAAIYTVAAYVLGEFTRTIGIILLVMFVVYMTITIRSAVKGAKAGEVVETEENTETQADMPVWKTIVLIVVGAALIAVGARLLVNNGTKIATALGVPDSVIALTFVALGTSLPELVTAITSLAKGHGALSLGNVIGANLFNLVLVSGVAVSISPFAVPAEKTIAGINSSLVVDIPVMWFVMLLLTLPALIKGKLSRSQGIILLVSYVAFIIYQFAI